MNPFRAFLGQSVVPPWLVVLFVLVSVLQLFGINSLDLYSSGVTLQAIGVGLRRYQAVLLDSAIAMAVTFYAVFDSSFSAFLKDFVDVVIVWIAPWSAIFMTDWLLRRDPLRGRPSCRRPTARSVLTAPPAGTGAPCWHSSSAWWPPSRRCRPPSPSPRG